MRETVRRVAHAGIEQCALEGQDQVAFEKHSALARTLGRRRGLSSARYAQQAPQVGTVGVIGALTEEDTMLSQLTSVLATCKSRGERAARGLDMLARSSGALGGLFYALSSGRAMPRAQVGRLVPDERIDALARDYLSSKITDENDTRTVGDATAPSFIREWRGPGDVRYVPVLLSHPVKRGLAISGVAVLLIDATARFSYPGALATELSRVCQEAGDVTVAII
ncbi:MAG TPA: hypothetical protein VHC69_10895 [Polyangiaceae bacterium]|nr:hypothetical protein [Polyangiaceae bacterium]